MVSRRPVARASSAQNDVPSNDTLAGAQVVPEKNDEGGQRGLGPCRNDASRRRWIRWLSSARITRRSLSAVVFVSSAGAISALFLFQLRAYILEYQGPLDHVTTSLFEPSYGMFCPDFSSDAGSNITDSTNNEERPDTVASWDCNYVVPGSGAPEFPRIFMIGARNDDDDTFLLWEQALQSKALFGDGDGQPRHGAPHLERISTLRVSNLYALSGGALRQLSKSKSNRHLDASLRSLNEKRQRLCRKMKWEQRLFAIYQWVFSSILLTYPEDPGFVFVEDDALLMHPTIFFREVCEAHRGRMEFYSLYRSPLQGSGKKSSSCVYLHGTVAFYVRRRVMEEVVNERRRGMFCRFPIDMYISKMGPWYATRNEIVVHLDLGRVGSTT